MRFVNRRERTRGQSLVEFALVLPVFLLVLFGLIDGARLVYMTSTISNAAREGARLASVEASWMSNADASCGTVGGPVCPANIAALKADITAAANREMAPFGSVTNLYISCDAPSATPPTGNWTTGGSCTSATKSGDQVSVRVTYAWTPITPIAGNILGNITASGAVTMIVN